MARAGLADGDWIEIASDHGAIKVTAQADETVRSGVVSITHGFGGLPEDADADADGSGYLQNGACVNLLISTDRDLQTLNAMPRMSAIPVNIRKVN
jgi:anaerobic selenocysteine-containing dehydrogenase